MSDSGSRDLESIDDALLKARIKARLLGDASPVCLGRFELLTRLGRGGEGTVYEARDRRDGSLVALKQLHPAHAASGASLKHEFRALSNLVHPNLVVLYELFHEASHWFFTMELVAGQDFLRNAENGVRPPHDARLRGSLAQLLSGLAALHAAGKMHRDLKPSNVLVRADGGVVILDYGLVTERGTSGSDCAGTPAYAAPEQALGHAEPASDLYAVGAMLFHALTGRLPFDGTPAQMLEQKQRGIAPRPSAIRRGVSPDLDALCAALLARDPSARPTAARALMACAGEVALAAPSLALEREGPMASDCFVGRARLLDELGALSLQCARRPVFVLLDGESGIGKTSLIQHFCAMRAEAGALVLDGRCYERENLPYKALDAIVERLVSHLNAFSESPALALPPEQLAALIRLFPAFRRLHQLPTIEPEAGASGDDGELRGHAFLAVKALFSAISATRDVVFVVDDLQWGDLDSIDLLEYLLDSADAPRIFLLCAYRTEERDTSPAMQAILCGEALAGAHLSRFERTVGPLAREEAAALLHELARTHGWLEPAQVEACLAQASGMPFALHQLAEHAKDLGLASSGPSGPLSELVRLRAQRCSPAAGRLLEVICVAGRPLETAIALRSCFGEPVGWPAAAELCGRRLARWRDAEHERCLEPYHDLVRVAIARATPAPRARQIHRDIVEALEVLSPDRPEHFVEHLLAAGEQARAGRMALLAAERAGAQLAWNRSAELLGIARRTLGVDELRHERLAERLAAALAAANRYRAAAAAYIDAAAEHGADRGERQRLECLAAQQLMRAGDTEAGVALLERLLAEVGYRYPRSLLTAELTFMVNRVRQRIAGLRRGPPALPPRSTESEHKMRVLAAAHNELWATEPLRGTVIHTWFFREALRCRDHRLQQALAWEGGQLAVRYGPRAKARVKRVLAQVDTFSSETATAHERAVQQLARALFALYCCWEPREALVQFAAADRMFRETCPGSHFERDWIALMTDLGRELTGDFPALLTTIAQRERRGSEEGDPPPQLLVAVPLGRLLQNRPDDALAYVEKHWKVPSFFTLLDYAVLIRVSTALLYRGDVDAAHRCLLDVWWDLRRSGLFVTQVAENASYHRARNAAALYWQTRDRALKREVEQRVAGAAHLPPAVRGLFRLAGASVARAAGRSSRCRALLLAALDDCMTHGADAGVWCARYRLAQLDGAKEALAEAEAWFVDRGVRCPERWVALSVPGPDGFA